MKNEPIDAGKRIDWSRASEDYQKHRRGYPADFYDLVARLGIGLTGQRILDLGTGTGELARNFAVRGAEVTGIDIAEGQIKTARRLATEQKLQVDFRVGSAEEIDFPEAAFDAVTASMCWVYFDEERLIPALSRILRPGGKVLLCSLFWLPREDAVVAASEDLILRYNPAWTGAGYTGEGLPEIPCWAEKDYELLTYHKEKVVVPYRLEGWMGRIRASRGVGPSLSAEQMREFDRDHKAILQGWETEVFGIRHLIKVQVFGKR